MFLKLLQNFRNITPKIIRRFSLKNSEIFLKWFFKFPKIAPEFSQNYSKVNPKFTLKSSQTGFEIFLKWLGSFPKLSAILENLLTSYFRGFYQQILENILRNFPKMTWKFYFDISANFLQIFPRLLQNFSKITPKFS